ncbi:alkaline ceramidase ydc1 [Basidiobolus ranarum]|uniref:Alkaline ceramidase ydc1 n=1 Tax=Basidiobolus ranarum TaxID=34480 RepID=A0ABR2W777_9FUNG
MYIYFAESLNAITLGYWGKRTATLDWCEENYVVCKYIAEFHNTLTNAVFVLLALYGLHTVKKLKMETRFLTSFGTFMMVGIGSWCFHMTLLYEMQLLDELPMLFATCVLIYSVFETKETSIYGWKFPVLLFVIATLISTIYILVKSPLFHQLSYGCLTAVLVFRALYLFISLPSGPAKRSMQRLLITSWGSYALGFLAWNIDNEFCPQIRAARAYLGSPWDSLLQLHGWWHILTGLGSYVYIVFSQYIRQIQLGKKDLYTIHWTMGVLPTVALANGKPKLV